MTKANEIIGKILGPKNKSQKKNKLLNIKNFRGSSESYKVLKKKFPKLDPFGDFDNDGVPNFRDCQPFNTMRQDQVVEKANSGRAFRITWPDGRLVHYYKYRPKDFRMYMIDLVGKYGLNPDVRTFKVEYGTYQGVPILTAYW